MSRSVPWFATLVSVHQVRTNYVLGPELYFSSFVNYGMLKQQSQPRFRLYSLLRFYQKDRLSTLKFPIQVYHERIQATLPFIPDKSAVLMRRKILTRLVFITPQPFVHTGKIHTMHGFWNIVFYALEQLTGRPAIIEHHAPVVSDLTDDPGPAGGINWSRFRSHRLYPFYPHRTF